MRKSTITATKEQEDRVESEDTHKTTMFDCGEYVCVFI